MDKLAVAGVDATWVARLLELPLLKNTRSPGCSWLLETEVPLSIWLEAVRLMV